MINKVINRKFKKIKSLFIIKRIFLVNRILEFLNVIFIYIIKEMTKTVQMK